tara:strand:- start:381 stop:764 length:384 start_codon:yes stop_codon:yes gene_type:complete
LTTDFKVFEVGEDATNSPSSERFPDNCNIQSVEFEFTTKGSAGTVTMFLARDSAGSVGITPAGTTGATSTITVGTVNSKGSTAFSVDNDYHFDSSVSNSKAGSIYIVAKVDNATGSPAANIRVNWRG